MPAAPAEYPQPTPEERRRLARLVVDLYLMKSKPASSQAGSPGNHAPATVPADEV